MLRHNELFNKTLDSLKITGIYIDNFSPEQIFYQIETATAARISELECDVNKSYKRYLREKHAYNDHIIKEDNNEENDCVTSEDDDGYELSECNNSSDYESTDEEDEI